MSDISGRAFVTADELARVTGISKPTLDREIRAGHIPSLRIGHTVRMPRRWLEAQTRDVGLSLVDRSGAEDR
jgi:excisionase family DNA binding protein